MINDYQKEPSTMTKKRSFIPAAAKILLALASFTGTIGLWNFLANKDYQVGGINQNPDKEMPNLRPMPTLVALVTITEENTNPTSPVVNSLPITELRKVELSLAPVAASQPRLSINNAPEILPAPVANTNSSR